jgi:chemotaxis response regulator CheB
MPRSGQGSFPRIIVIGASTGGVEALYQLLSGIPPDCPPIFVVQHIRAGYVESLVAGLNRTCAAEVVQASDRQIARPGRICIAPAGDLHLVLTPNPEPMSRLVEGPPLQGHRPAVDRLFTSAAQLDPPPVAALLTGMGRDGAEGMLRIRQAGGHTIAQDEQTAVVYGMPRAARELNAASQILPLKSIAAAMLRGAGYTQPRSRDRHIG